MNNDQLILDQIVEEQWLARAPDAKKSEFFETYVAEQLLKNFDLSDDEIESGLVGNSLDGGIDGIYTFANGELVLEDFDHSGLKKNVLVEVVIFQSKTSNGFDEETINKFSAVTGHLFSLANTLDVFKDRYNEGLRSSVELFRRLYTQTAARFPTLHFHYIYATRGNSAEVHSNVKAKSEDLRGVVRNLFKNADFKFSFYGAADLLELARQEPTTSFNIQFVEILTGQSGYVALVKLKDFIRFLRDENEVLRKTLFEANVRDYQGSTQVNEEMQQSLKARGPEDFWWLNNGVTVVAKKAVQAGKVLTVEDPQIVNGQQSSTEIYNYFRDANTDGDDRSVMVRVIVVTDAQSRDRIIKATNSQTSIPPASLRATEKIHRDIEAYLASYSIYYDRRKNSQKQSGKPVDSIISIGALAQSMMAIVLQRPDDARARPSSLIKKDEDYARIFSNSLPISMYLMAAKIAKTAHAFLRSREDLAPKDRTNLLFYVAMVSSAVLAGKAEPKVDDLVAIDVAVIDVSVMGSSMDVVEPIYRELGANDQISKGPLLLARLKQALTERYPLTVMN